MKILTVLDCFVSDNSIEKILEKSIENMRKVGDDILLVSTNKISESIQSKVDFAFYDSRNQLFEKEDYIYTQPWHFWIECGGFLSHNFYYSKQRHGLAVLINLINSLNLAKSLGYTHFRKVLYDWDLTSDDIQKIKNIPSLCQAEEKKGLLYFNLDQGETCDVEGKIIFCEIEYFLKSIPQIKNEEDYRNFLLSNFGKLDFYIFERFLYFNLNKAKDQLIIKNQGDFKKDFSVSGEKSKTTELNFDSRYQGCPSRITRIDGSENLLIMTHNFSGTLRSRKIIVFDKNLNSYTIEFSVPPDSWFYHPIDRNIEKIEVYNGEEFLYSEFNISEKIQNYIKYHEV